MKIQFDLIIILFTFILHYVNSITLRAIANGLNGAKNTYLPIITEFNKYSKKKNLDIKIELELFLEENATYSVVDYEQTLEFFFSKNPKKYDLVFFDNIYSKRFGPHLVNLRDYLPDEHFKMYEPGIAPQTCVYKDKWVGLPLTVDFAVIYSNKGLLSKYNKTPPKTWDELMNIGLEIYEKEKSQNNTDLLIYNGLFPDVEVGTCSVYEFIYSYRKDINSPMPYITSNEAVKALKMIKKMKEAFNYESEFKKSEQFTIERMFNNKFIFLKFWYLGNLTDYYDLSPLPGGKEGVSGSSLGGFNVGINKYSKYINETAVALEFITTKDIQKKYFAESYLYSPIPSMYDDDNICSKVDCNFFKSIQLIARPTNYTDNYNEYSEKYRKNIYKYLYGDDTAIDALRMVENLSKIYYLKLGSNDETSIGLIIFICTITIIIFMLLSLVFPLIKTGKEYFNFLSNDLWIIIIFGCVTLISACFPNFGPMTVFKCQLEQILLSIGFTLSFSPILLKFSTQIPLENKYSIWCNNNKYVFIICLVLIDVIINGLSFISSYKIVDNAYPGEKIFQTCKLNKTKLFLILSIIYKFILAIMMSILTFIEWNIESIMYDVRISIFSLYIDILSIISFLIFRNATIKDYTMYYTLNFITFFTIALSNYIFLYGFRIILLIIKKHKTEEIQFIKEIRKNNFSISKTKNVTQSTDSGTSSGNRSLNSFTDLSNKLIQMHYMRYEGKNSTDSFTSAQSVKQSIPSSSN